MISVIEKESIILMRCKVCGSLKAVLSDDVRFVYTEINNFRGDHQHLEELKWKRNQGK